MSAAKASKTSPKSRRELVQTWLIRAGVAIVAGLVVGGAGGVMGVNRFDPGRPGQPDSLQLMLDSQQKRDDADSPLALRRAADSADAARRAKRAADSIALANDPNAPQVPNVVGLEEGAARDAIEQADLVVGTVIFRANDAIAGTVLESTPAAGRKARAGTPIDLVLSDGRVGPPADTTQVDSLPASGSLSIDTLTVDTLSIDTLSIDTLSIDTLRVVPPPPARPNSR